jgi:enhancing lycopene biosynthesis protein 2
MAKRVGVVLSGCGSEDGSEVQESLLTLLSIERAGAESVCMAPDVAQTRLVDHLTGQVDAAAQPRRVLVEAARIARSRIRDIATVRDDELDALVVPGGFGVAHILSNYADKGVVCEVHPDVVRLLKAMLARRQPMGFVCIAPILAARVLGPITGVRITFGRACEPAKHAAVMGADVRPCPVREVVVDQKARVVSTPAYMLDEARLGDVAVAVDKLVRTMLSLGRDRRPRPQPVPGRPQPRPGQGDQAARPSQPTQPAGAPILRKRPPAPTRPGGGSS